MKKYLFVFMISVLPIVAKPEPSDIRTVTTEVGTVPVEGGADGVAIWYNKQNPSRSTVIGSQPKKGLTVFSLDGQIIQQIRFPKGGSGEVDVRHDFPLGSGKVSLVAGGKNAEKGIFAYKVNPGNGTLVDLMENTQVLTNIEPHGSCLYKSRKTGAFFLFITSKEGIIEQYEMIPGKDDSVEPKLVRTIRHNEGRNRVIEACVADDETGKLYVAQENECTIWCYKAEPDADETHLLVDNALIKKGDNVEGLAIVPSDNPGNGYLIASVQGSWLYRVYTKKTPHKLIGTFQLTIKENNETVHSHDCIEVVAAPMGKAFSEGLFVTQNANNAEGYHFQLVSWERILKEIDPDGDRAESMGEAKATVHVTDSGGQDRAVALIRPGIGIGKVTFNMTADDVKAMLGEPDSETEGIYYLYADLGLEVLFKEGKVHSFCCVHRIDNDPHVKACNYRTKEGVGIGSTASDIESAYGKAFVCCNGTWMYKDLKFGVKNGHVQSIRISKLN
jgi:3-phytase